MTEHVTADAAARRRYDIVIVGAGWAGSALAQRLGDKGWQVLVLEAGNGDTDTWPGFLDTLSTFRSAVAKVPNSAYRPNAAAPSPNVLDLAPVRNPRPGEPEFTAGGYFVQNGPLPYGTDYLRALGGTAMHWLGAVPRMRDEDFETRTRYGYGRDWPIGAAELQPWYAEAERLLGAAGHGQEQYDLGVVHDSRYEYPMQEIPRSYIDRYCKEAVEGEVITDPVAERDYTLTLYGLPQARNSTPNPRYRTDPPFRVRGAVGLPNFGERCVGNASCVPICPVQAKSLPLRIQAAFPRSVTVANRCVVTRVRRSGERSVSGVEYRTYTDPASPVSRSYVVEADVVVLAAHAIENARLLLFSELANGSGQVGRNLMDHPTVLSWALGAESKGPVGPFRGPGHTSGWEVFRFGEGRRRRAPFRIEIGNWGWGWATGAPMSNVATALGIGGDEHGEVRPDGVFGPELRRLLGSSVGRQLQLQLAVEQPADPGNRVTLDGRHRDAMGNPRPVITYDLSEHVRDGALAARAVAGEIFRRMGADDFTNHAPRDGVPPLGHFVHKGTDLAYSGAGHGAGTHIMGSDPATSVVDADQKTHEFDNLYAVGCGSMASVGTSNPTLTMMALALRSAERIHDSLATARRPVVIRTPDTTEATA
ncbi:GMC family oxidoreductase [Streptosporangium nondiastaticum]|uniref:GMC family oxidoreductase n=1 Tax=Streptosporangium nondiastaticum TaxID=35764 RepID=A0A9X7PJU7_9ACTN|nr:GMC family oxidoreductase [Streptosporangium nondiastaticum]PSJ30563.1 GMC family oxidoreductase [Streptosporangium nondiastaticum]